MTIDQLKKAIHFQARDIGDDYIHVEARLEVRAWREYVRFERDGYKDPSDFDEMMRDSLTEEIIRKLYDDRRAELYAATMDFLREDQTDWNRMLEARARLLNAAERQQPLRSAP